MLSEHALQRYQQALQAGHAGMWKWHLQTQIFYLDCKGGSANVGAKELTALCQDIEAKAKQCDISAAAELAAQLPQAAQRVQAVLETLKYVE